MNKWLSDNLPTTGTFSKDPRFWGFDEDVRVTAKYNHKLKLADSDIWDWYIDCTSSLGASVFGYTNEFEAMLYQAIDKGVDATLPWQSETKAAELLALLLSRNVPSWEGQRLGVRWCLSGSDATTMAVRLARAVTGREEVITFVGHYHGWGGWSIGRTSPAWGVPYPPTREVDKVDLDQIEEDIKNDFVASIIFEHPAQDTPPESWQQIRKLCDKYGVLLIADEVVTGLRYGPGGACQRYSIEPDIVCMGKALGNGVPVGAVIAPTEYIDWFARTDPVFCSSTGWGNNLGLSAAEYVITEYLERGDEIVNQLNFLGQLLLDRLKKSGWDVIGHAPRSVIQFDSPEQHGYFCNEMKAAGVLMNRPNLLNTSFTPEDIEMIVREAGEVRGRFNYYEYDGATPRKLFDKR